MPKKTFTPEQIVGKLRQIEVLVSQGKTVPVACRKAGIVEQTFYRWRKEYGGLQLEQLSQAIITWPVSTAVRLQKGHGPAAAGGSLAIDVGKFVVSSESCETFMAPLTASNQRP
jgi:transposase